jgi:hypothetical protein
MMECRLMPCLCIGSCFESDLFHGPCNHTSHSLPHFMVFDAFMRHPIFRFPIESTLSPLIWMGPWQILSNPITNDFLQFPQIP